MPGKFRDAERLFFPESWGAGYFSINDKGHVQVDVPDEAVIHGRNVDHIGNLLETLDEVRYLLHGDSSVLPDINPAFGWIKP